MSKSQLIGVGASAGAALSWGSATVISKDLLGDFDPVSLLLIQLSVSVALLWLVVLWRNRGVKHRRQRARAVLGFAWLGALEPALAYLLCLTGLAGATASATTLIQAAESITIVGITAAVTRRLPSVPFLIISILAVAGVARALGVESDEALSANSATAIALVAAGTFTAAIYVFLSGKVANRADALTITAWQQSVALGLVGLVELALHIFGTSAHFSSGLSLTHAASSPVHRVLLCAACGLLQFAVPFSLYMVALQRLSANVAGSMLLLTPLVGLAEAHTLLGERLSQQQWTGSVVALAAVAALGIIGIQTRQLHAASAAQT